jgi:flagellar export protein FliJ
MKKDNQLRSLARLTLLRERQVEHLSADMAGRRAVQNRYLGNIQRLEKLYQSTGASIGSARLPLSALYSNCAAYKQAVMKMTDAHRVDLSLHEAEMELARRSLAAAVQRHDALDQVLARARAGARQVISKREQTLQDETAVQVWTRGRK